MKCRCGRQVDNDNYRTCSVCRKKAREYMRRKFGYAPVKTEERLPETKEDRKRVEDWFKQFEERAAKETHRCARCPEGTIIDDGIYYCRLPKGYCIVDGTD